MRFVNQVALITGSGSEHGIGKSTALMFAREGADIIVADMNLEGAKKVAKEIEDLGRTALAVQVDIADEQSVRKMISEVETKFDRIDILVNNAGITQPIKTVDMTLDDFSRNIKVNLIGTFLVTKAVLPFMLKHNYGRIVMLSSVSAKRGGGVYGGSHYSAAKAGMLGFAKALAREVVDYGVTVNSVCPGLVATDIRAGLSDEQERAIWKTIPMLRPGTAEEVSAAILFLASREASYITGEDIDVNGGSHMD